MSDPKVFTITINGHDEEIDCSTLCKHSKKIKDLVNNSEYSIVIDHPVSETASEAFIAALKCDRFKLTPEIAPELLYLSNEWEIETLEQPIRAFMKAKGISTDIELPNVDYLGELLSVSDDHLASDFLYKQVGKRLNDYFDDKRLLELNAESLFRVILNSEASENKLDQEKYRDFVIKMFNPESEDDYKYIYTAVPLILRLNFSKLLPYQDDTIYGSPEVYDQNINYFIAMAISATRNLSEQQRTKLTEAIQSNIQNLQQDLRNKRHEDARLLHDEHKQKVDQLKQIISKQRRQIDALKEFREDQMKRHEEENSLFLQQSNELREQMAKEKENLSARVQAFQQLKDDVKEEIENDPYGVKDQILKELKKEGKVIKSRPDVLKKAVQEPIENLINDFDEMQNRINELSEYVNKISEDLRDKQKILAAKMVNDFMRFDKFVRRTAKQFKVFGEIDVWGLEPDDVKKAGKEYLTYMERKIDQYCPIGHNVIQ